LTISSPGCTACGLFCRNSAGSATSQCAHRFKAEDDQPVSIDTPQKLPVSGIDQFQQFIGKGEIVRDRAGKLAGACRLGGRSG
jgi:hypothetical protein